MMFGCRILNEQVKLISKCDSDYDLVYADALNFGEGVHGNRTSMQTNPSHGKVTLKSFFAENATLLLQLSWRVDNQ